MNVCARPLCRHANAGVGAGINLESACADTEAICAGILAGQAIQTGLNTTTEGGLLLLEVFACCSEIIQSLGPESEDDLNLGIALLLQGALSLGEAIGGDAGFDSMVIEIDPERQCALSASIGIEGGNGGEVIATSELLAINVGAGIGYTEGNIDNQSGANVGAGAVLNAAIAGGFVSGGDATAGEIIIGGGGD